MTEEINNQVDLILEGTEAIEPKPKKKRVSKPKEPKPFSLNDCELSTNLLSLWGKMTDKVSWPIGVAPTSIDIFEPIYNKAMAYCAMFPINIADVKVSWFFDLQTMKEKDYTEFDAELLKLTSNFTTLDTAIESAKKVVKTDEVASLFKADFDRIISDLEKDISQKRGNLESYQNEYAKIVSKLESLVLELEHAKVDASKPAVCPPEFLSNDFFKLVKVKDGLCYFVTKDVMLIDPRVGGCKPVNMGRFLVRINPKEFKTSSVRIYPFINNIVQRDHWHPHINEEGSICWGNAFEPAAQGFRNRDYRQFFKVLYSLIATYNSGSPYVCMSDFFSGQDTRYITGKGFASYLNSKYYFGVLDYIASAQIITSLGTTSTIKRFLSSLGVDINLSEEYSTFKMDKLSSLETKVFTINEELIIPEEFYDFDEANSKAIIKSSKKEIIPFMKGDFLTLKLGQIIHNQVTATETVKVETALSWTYNKDQWKAILKANEAKATTINEILLKVKASLEGAKDETTTN